MHDILPGLFGISISDTAAIICKSDDVRRPPNSLSGRWLGWISSQNWCSIIILRKLIRNLRTVTSVRSSKNLVGQ